MNCPLLSILVPVYNSEKYIERCISSISKIRLFELEIVVVNDGSTDFTSALLEKIAIQEPRLRIVNQENKGISYTRNVCLEHSLGKYIAFVDSDDWIEANKFEKAFEDVINKNIDVSMSPFVFHEDKRDKILGVIKNIEQGRQSYIDSEWATLWRLIIKKTIIDTNHIRFPDKIDGGEDYYFTNLVLMNAKSLLINKYVYYNYDYSNGNSFTHELNRKKIYYQIDATKLLEKYISKENKKVCTDQLLLKRKFLAKKDLLQIDVDEWKKVFPECNSHSYKYLKFREYLPFYLLLHKYYGLFFFLKKLFS